MKTKEPRAGIPNNQYLYPQMHPNLRKDIIQWEVANWSRTLDFWAPHLPKKPANVLALGERHGGLSLHFAKLGYNVTSTDLEGVSDQAKELHKKYEVSDKITYKEADMMSLPFGDDSFEIITFKSVLGALSTKENQQKAIDEIHRVLKPGGVLLFAENLEGTSLHRWIRKKFVKWSNYWRYLHPKKDMDLFNKFTKTQTKTRGVIALFGRSESQRNILAKLDTPLGSITPKNAKYILFGVAKK